MQYKNLELIAKPDLKDDPELDNWIALLEMDRADDMPKYDENSPEFTEDEKRTYSPKLTKDEKRTLIQSVRKIQQISFTQPNNSTNLYDLINQFDNDDEFYSNEFCSLVRFIIDQAFLCVEVKLPFLVLLINKLSIPKFQQAISVFDVGELYDLYVTKQNIFNSLTDLMTQLTAAGLKQLLANKALEDLTDQDIQSMQSNVQQIDFMLSASASQTWGQLRPILGPSTNNKNTPNYNPLENIAPSSIIDNIILQSPRFKYDTESNDDDMDIEYDSDASKSSLN